MMKLDSNRLNEIFRKAGSVLGAKLDTVGTMVEKGMLANVSVIMRNPLPPTSQNTTGTKGYNEQQTAPALPAGRNAFTGNFFLRPSDSTTPHSNSSILTHQYASMYRLLCTLLPLIVHWSCSFAQYCNCKLPHLWITISITLEH